MQMIPRFLFLLRLRKIKDMVMLYGEKSKYYK